jgi:Plavaka transposase
MNRKLPARFRDMLPQPLMPLPPPSEALESQVAHRRPASPGPASPAALERDPAARGTSPMPRTMFKTHTNSFGLFRLFDERTLPSHDPEDPSGEILPQNKEMQANVDNPFHPYPNENSFRLGDWYWNHGLQKSKAAFKSLIDIVGNSEFRAEDVRNTPWIAIDHEMGNLATPDDADSAEWLDENSGWKSSPVTISVPFPRRSLHPGPKNYTVTDFYRRSLVSIIRERVSDPVHHRLFHYEPYKLRWHPPHRAHDIGVYGDLFTSPAFFESHCALQDSPPEPGCSLPRRIVALMFWSDATQLTSFSDAKLWPLYLFFGNESKYSRCCPSANLCAHAAYFQTVGSPLASSDGPVIFTFYSLVTG